VTYPNSKILFGSGTRNVYRFRGQVLHHPGMLLYYLPRLGMSSARIVFSKQQETISLAGRLKYQACDKTICYSPHTSGALKWELHRYSLSTSNGAPNAIRLQVSIRSWIESSLLEGEKSMGDVVYVVPNLESSAGRDPSASRICQANPSR